MGGGMMRVVEASRSSTSIMQHINKNRLLSAYMIASGAFLSYKLIKLLRREYKRRKNKDNLSCDSRKGGQLRKSLEQSEDKQIQVDDEQVQRDSKANQPLVPPSSRSLPSPQSSHSSSSSTPSFLPADIAPASNVLPVESSTSENIGELSPGCVNIVQKKKGTSVINLEELASMLPKQIVEEDKRKILKVCLTGGPCAGKTSGLAFLSEKLRDDDFHVFMVPEAATLLANGGGMLDFGGYSPDEVISFQKSLMGVQIALEDQFYNLAKISNTQSILLCDRGLIDGKAFMTDDQWARLLKELKFTEREIRDERYDSVIHMVTAADGVITLTLHFMLPTPISYQAGEHYVMEGARFQNLEQAVDIDKKFQEAWLGHPRLEIIDNRSVNSFAEKLEKLLFTVRKNCGVPVKGRKLYKRYVIDDPESHPNLPQDLQVARVACWGILILLLLLFLLLLLSFRLRASRSKTRSCTIRATTRSRGS